MRKYGFLKHKNQCYISIIATLALLITHTHTQFALTTKMLGVFKGHNLFHLFKN